MPSTREGSRSAAPARTGRFSHPEGEPLGTTATGGASSPFARPAAEVAPRLLGAVVASTVGGELTSGRIVETEAYIGPHDPACHAAEGIGRTRRNAAMFGPGGIAYVYFIYGMHWCFNVVTGERDRGEAVLVRALEPIDGQDTMARRRGRAHDLTSGPARLCAALGIDGRLDGHPLDAPPLCILPGVPPTPERIGVSGRIGIREARDWPLRFFLEGNPHVSRGPHVALPSPEARR